MSPRVGGALIVRDDSPTASLVGSSLQAQCCCISVELISELGPAVSMKHVFCPPTYAILQQTSEFCIKVWYMSVPTGECCHDSSVKEASSAAGPPVFLASFLAR